MNPNLKPTVGRVVWYYPSVQNDRVDPQSGKGQPYPAVITHVWGDSVVNLAVQNDGSFPLKPEALTPTSVSLAPEGAEVIDGRCWSWMPFQVGQAEKNANEVTALVAKITATEQEVAELAKAIKDAPDGPVRAVSGPDGSPSIGRIKEAVLLLAACEHADVQDAINELFN